MIIPDGYRPTADQYASIDLVVSSNISGSARFKFGADGTISFLANITEIREYNGFAVWTV